MRGMNYLGLEEWRARKETTTEVREKKSLGLRERVSWRTGGTKLKRCGRMDRTWELAGWQVNHNSFGGPESADGEGRASDKSS